MPIALKANGNRGQTSNDSLFKKGNRFDRENRFGNDGDRFDKGHRSKGVVRSRGKRNCYSCGSKNHFVYDCLKAKMKKAFIGGAWSDSEDGDQMEKDATCLMMIGSQKGVKMKNRVLMICQMSILNWYLLKLESTIDDS
ncbi:putative ribonuclease H-like domain-containing protein [Tanacetum coccineum]